MFRRRKFTLGMSQQTVRNFCPKFVRNERKSVRKLNDRNKTSEFLTSEIFASNVYVFVVVTTKLQRRFISRSCKGHEYLLNLTPRKQSKT